jgi:hypothetical protein
MSFWDIHGILFILFMFLFPRLTMFLTCICFMPFAHPILFWIGWFLTPRFVIAILATTFYLFTNPVLCIFAWINALYIGSLTTKATVDEVRRK